MAEFLTRFQNAWNAFLGREPTNRFLDNNWYGGYSNRPDRTRMYYGNERSIVSSIYNRISVDCAQIQIKHVKTDENDRYVETVHSKLNNCLTLDANLDQTGRALIQDIVLSMFDEGCIAVVPTDTSTDPNKTDSYDILALRAGRITEWFPYYVKVELYNENTGKNQEVIMNKKDVAIIENPFYAVMNEPNSTLRRLIRKLNLLDVVDEQSSAGKLDLIIQLPYTIRTDARRKQAEDRRADIEKQLAGSKYGIAYADATEHITQLNRPVENNLMNQITFLTSMLYSQLGITEEILKGTADQQTMLNYFNNTVAPCASELVISMKWKFLTKTARTRHHSIKYFRDPFKNTPIDKIAEMVDKFTRNEIASSNEMRSVIGWKPVDDPRADELRNKNLNTEAGYQPMYTEGNEGESEGSVGQMKLSEITGS